MYVIYLCIVFWYYPLFVAICEIWLLRLTYGAYLVLSLKSGITLNYLKWKTFEYQVVRDHKDPNFLYRPFSIWESLSKQYSPNLEYHINYMKQYVRIANFQLHLPKTLSNAKMVFILNVDLDEWNNISIHVFSSRDPLGFQKSLHVYEFIQN